jgi:hypothetical protein
VYCGTCVVMGEGLFLKGNVNQLNVGVAEGKWVTTHSCIVAHIPRALHYTASRVLVSSSF